MFDSKNKIEKVFARQILDSRGLPTLEATVVLSGGITGTASVPSGASTGKKEVVELRDGGNDFYGKGVLNAVENVNTEINSALLGMNATDQYEIDQKMIKLDGTPNRARLGGNAIIGVSLACARAAAKSQNLELFDYLKKIGGARRQVFPRPMFNLINGGLHADDSLDVQEFLFIPKFEDFYRNLKAGAEVYQSLTQVLREHGFHTGVGDEGGFAPKFLNNAQGFEVIIEAATKAGYEIVKDYGLGIDAAANSFVISSDPFKYKFKLENKEFSSEELLALYLDWVEKYKLITIEDGFSEDDRNGWSIITKALGGEVHLVNKKAELVGDDLFVTRAEKLIDGASDKIGTAIIIKPNQVGTLTETIQTVRKAKELGYVCVASHRSGDTTDDFIADMAVGLGCEYIKTGAPARGERVAKYNRLLQIAQSI